MKLNLALNCFFFFFLVLGFVIDFKETHIYCLNIQYFHTNCKKKKKIRSVKITKQFIFIWKHKNLSILSPKLSLFFYLENTVFNFKTSYNKRMYNKYILLCWSMNSTFPIIEHIYTHISPFFRLLFLFFLKMVRWLI